MSARYVAIHSPLGATAAENGIDLAPDRDRYRLRAEHLEYLRSGNGALDAACESGRIAVRRVALAGDQAEACDRAWRAICQPWRLASSTRGDAVQGTGEGLGSATVTR